MSTRFALSIKSNPDESNTGILAALRDLLGVGTTTARRYLNSGQTTLIDLPDGMNKGQRNLLVAGIRAAQDGAVVQLHTLQHKPNQRGNWKVYRIDDRNPYHYANVKVLTDQHGNFIYQEGDSFRVSTENDYDDPKTFACILEGRTDYLDSSYRAK